MSARPEGKRVRLGSEDVSFYSLWGLRPKSTDFFHWRAKAGWFAQKMKPARRSCLLYYGHCQRGLCCFQRKDSITLTDYNGSVKGFFLWPRPCQVINKVEKGLRQDPPASGELTASASLLIYHVYTMRVWRRLQCQLKWLSQCCYIVCLIGNYCRHDTERTQCGSFVANNTLHFTTPPSSGTALRLFMPWHDINRHYKCRFKGSF